MGMDWSKFGTGFWVVLGGAAALLLAGVLGGLVGKARG